MRSEGVEAALPSKPWLLVVLSWLSRARGLVVAQSLLCMDMSIRQFWSVELECLDTK